MQMSIDYLLKFSGTLIVSTICAILLLSSYILLKWKSKAQTLKTPPEPKGGWPIIGHLHKLAQPTNLLHVTLGSMADELGPIFTLRLGIGQAVVVSSWELVKECFTKNDVAFASRPKLLAAEHLGYDYAMFGYAPYGAYWREIRKVSTVELLSAHRLEGLVRIRTHEVEESIKELYKVWYRSKDELGWALIEMKQWASDLTLNTIVRMVAGKRYHEIPLGWELI